MLRLAKSTKSSQILAGQQSRKVLNKFCVRFVIYSAFLVLRRGFVSDGALFSLGSSAGVSSFFKH